MIDKLNELFLLSNLKKNFILIIIFFILGLIFLGAGLKYIKPTYYANETLYNYGGVSYSKNQIESVNKIGQEILSVKNLFDIAITTSINNLISNNIRNDKTLLKEFDENVFSVQGFLQSLILNNDFNNNFMKNFKENYFKTDNEFYISRSVTPTFFTQTKTQFYNINILFSSNSKEALNIYFSEYIEDVYQTTKKEFLERYNLYMEDCINILRAEIENIKFNLLSYNDIKDSGDLSNELSITNFLYDKIQNIENDINELNNKFEQNKLEIDLSIIHNQGVSNVGRDYVKEIIIMTIFIFYLFFVVAILGMYKKR